MQNQPIDLICSNCQAKLAASSSFCGNCGFPLRGSTPLILAKSLEPSNHHIVKMTWLQMKQLIILYSILLMSSLIFGLSSKAISSPNLEIIYWIINLILIIKFAKLTWNISRHSFEINEIKSTVALEIVLLSIISFFFLSLYFTTLEKLGVPKIGITGSYLNSGWPLWSVFVMSAILPGFFEEIIFRGIIQPNLAKLTSEKEALIVQAALFSVLHLLPIIFVSHFVMGLLAGWVRLRLGHIYYGIFLHVLWNSYVIYLEFNNM